MKKENLIIPTVVAHGTGQRFPKDIYYRTHSKLIARFTLCMPDGMLISVPIYEGENPIQKLNSYVDNWYKVTNADPEKFDHIILIDKCPKCGGELHAKDIENGRMIWCTNHPKCDYQTYCGNDKH